MGGRSRILAAVLAAVFVITSVLVAAPGATAKQKRIRGKLSEPGYTVIALAASGKARTDFARDGRFSLRPPANGVTLHLRAPDGIYAGPIVLARRKGGKRAVVGVRAGAKLGTIEINAEEGYANPKRAPKRALDTDLLARAKHGVPIGAGRAGLVRSRKTEGGGPGDRDLDGVPDVLDVDDDGDLVLDGYDHGKVRRASSRANVSARTTASSAGPGLGNFELRTETSDSIFVGYNNVNGGSTDEQVAAAMREGGALIMDWQVIDHPGDSGVDAGSEELDCGALSYCSLGGTGRITTDPDGPGPHTFRDFPECCDADHDGFGSLAVQREQAKLSLLTGAATDEIHSDDVLILRGTGDGTRVEYPASVGFIFATPAVIATYSDGQGDSGQFSYPRGPVFPGPPARAAASGDVGLDLTLWRPQRPRIVGEPAGSGWMDVGNLVYLVAVHKVTAPGDAPGGVCRKAALSTADPNLSLVNVEGTFPSLGGIYPNAGGIVDSRGDRPSNPDDTLAFGLNVSRCLASHGVSAEPGDVVDVQISAEAVGQRTSSAPPESHSDVSFQIQG